MRISLTGLFFAVNICLYSQQSAAPAKPCLFLAKYNTKGAGICADRGIKKAEVTDFKEFSELEQQFKSEHKDDAPFCFFISAKESIIIYEYDHPIPGYDCEPHIVNYKSGSSVENCEKSLFDDYSKYPKDYAAKPVIIFSRGPVEVKSEAKVTSLSKDFDGLKGKFKVGNNPGDNDVIVMQLTNPFKDKTAVVVVKTSGGKRSQVFIRPGETLTKSYETETLDLYFGYVKQGTNELEFNAMDYIKDKVRTVIIKQKDGLKAGKWDPTCACVRG